MSNFQTRHINAIAEVFAASGSWIEAVNAMADMLQADNPRFIRASFLNVCYGTMTLQEAAHLRRKIGREDRARRMAQWQYQDAR